MSDLEAIATFLEQENGNENKLAFLRLIEVGIPAGHLK